MVVFFGSLMTFSNAALLFQSCRNSFTLIGNVVIFGCFWGLLEHLNHDIDTANLTTKDKDIFQVSWFVRGQIQ